MTVVPWMQTRLPGGLLLNQQQRQAPGLLAARLWIAGGSSLDPLQQRGAHQLLAGLMTRGCAGLDAEALADLVEGRGAALRAEANEDSLVISLKCASDDAAELVPLLVQMVAAPQLDENQIAIEQQLNLQSLQRLREDPFQLCHEALRQQLYGDGAYGHDPLGIAPELEALEKPQLAALQHQQGRHGAALVLAGSLPAGCEARLAEALAQTPWMAAEPGQALPLRQASSSERLSLVEQDTEQVVLMLGCPTVPLGHPDNLPLRVLQAHLGLGMSSRLFVAMREERGLAYDVGVHMPARRGATPFVWHLSTSADRAAEACSALLDEWQRLRYDRLDAEALALAQAKYLGQEAFGRQTCGQVADRKALLLGFGLAPDFVEQCLEQARSFDARTLQAVAQRQLAAPKLSLCGPAAGLRAAEAAWSRHGLSQTTL
mgnify:CR=1 FL=1